MDRTENTFTDGSWISYAHWVRDALAVMRSGAPGQISLFESSVPEPSAMLADTTFRAYRSGPPASFTSVFMRSNPEIVAHLATRYGVRAANIHCTTGATTAVALLFGSLLSPGNTVLIEQPGFDIFTNCAHDAGMGVEFFRREAPAFDIVVADVLAALSSSTRIVVISNLHNPSGAKASKDVLSELAIALNDRGVLLLIDEVYQDYAGVDAHGLDLDLHPNVVRLGSLTKTFGLSAVRCGWVFTGGELMKRLKSHCDRADFGVSKLAHSVAAEVLANAEAYDGWRDGIMKASLPVASSLFGRMVDEGLLDMQFPLSSCICFPRVVGVTDTKALSRWLIERHRVVVVPGECFGMGGHIRVGFAADADKLRAGLERLMQGLLEYRDGSVVPLGPSGRSLNVG